MGRISVLLFLMMIGCSPKLISPETSYKEIIEKSLSISELKMGDEKEKIVGDLNENFSIMIDSNIRSYIPFLKGIEVKNEKVIFKEPEFFALHGYQFYVFFNKVQFTENSAFVRYVLVDKDKTKQKVISIEFKKLDNNWSIVEKNIVPNYGQNDIDYQIGMFIYDYINLYKEKSESLMNSEKSDLEIERELLKNKGLPR